MPAGGLDGLLRIHAYFTLQSAGGDVDGTTPETFPLFPPAHARCVRGAVGARAPAALDLLRDTNGMDETWPSDTADVVLVVRRRTGSCDVDGATSAPALPCRTRTSCGRGAERDAT
jgi:hypothetical protein